jgi:hypothetical protein
MDLNASIPATKPSCNHNDASKKPSHLKRAKALLISVIYLFTSQFSIWKVEILEI